MCSLKKDTSTPENARFWAAAKRSAAEVDAWPAWKFIGSAVIWRTRDALKGDNMTDTPQELLIKLLNHRDCPSHINITRALEPLQMPVDIRYGCTSSAVRYASWLIYVDGTSYVVKDNFDCREDAVAFCKKKGFNLVGGGDSK